MWPQRCSRSIWKLPSSKLLRRSKMDLVSSRVHSGGAENLALNERILHLKESGQEVINLSFGQSPFPPMPTAIKALQDNAHVTRYEPVRGTTPLRAAISAFHAAVDCVDVKPDNIIVGPGSKELLFLLMMVFKGDVIVPSPAWVTYSPQALLAGHDPVVMQLKMADEWRVTPEILDETASKCTTENKLLIFCSPDNPTGAGYTKEQLEALRPVILKHNITVVADEIYGFLTYAGDFVSMAKVCPEHTVLSSGISKWASCGGWRLGFHAFPQRLSSLGDAMAAAASHTYTSASAPVQAAALSLYQDVPAARLYRRHCCRILRAVGQYCLRELQQADLKCVMPKGGYYIFVDFEVVRPGLDKLGMTTCNELFVKIMDDTNVALLAGSPGCLRDQHELSCRLSFTDFNGSDALAASHALPDGANLPEGFVEKYCANTVDGIQRLVKWVGNVTRHV